MLIQVGDYLVAAEKDEWRLGVVDGEGEVTHPPLIKFRSWRDLVALAARILLTDPIRSQLPGVPEEILDTGRWLVEPGTRVTKLHERAWQALADSYRPGHSNTEGYLFDQVSMLFEMSLKASLVTLESDGERFPAMRAEELVLVAMRVLADARTARAVPDQYSPFLIHWVDGGTLVNLDNLQPVTPPRTPMEIVEELLANYGLIGRIMRAAEDVLHRAGI